MLLPLEVCLQPFLTIPQSDVFAGPCYLFAGKSDLHGSHNEELMWIILYADDISCVCDGAEELRTAVATVDATFLRWGLTISTDKTKMMVAGRDSALRAVITLRGAALEVVSQFKYLGRIIKADCTAVRSTLIV